MALEAVVGEQAAQVGWSAKYTPYMSQTSRSYQLADPNTPVTEGTGVASSVATLTRMRWLCLSESR